MKSIEEQLGLTLRLVEASRAAVTRIPIGPDSRAPDVIYRLGAAANEFSHVLDKLPQDLRYCVLFPTLVPAYPDHIAELLSIRTPTALQHEVAEAELMVAEMSACEYESQVARLRAQYALASKAALERINIDSKAAREQLSSIR